MEFYIIITFIWKLKICNSLRAINLKILIKIFKEVMCYFSFIVFTKGFWKIASFLEVFFYRYESLKDMLI